MSWISQLKTSRPSLFWRTFLLLCGLLFFSVIGWLQSFRVLSELPYSQGVAQHIVSTVNLTKYALVTADPLYRVDLLKTLAVRGMLAKNPTQKWQLRRLKVFAGNEHKHAAQKPEVWTVE